MPTEFKIISVSVVPSGTLEDDLSTAIMDALQPTPSGWRTVYVEKKASAAGKEAYMLMFEKD